MQASFTLKLEELTPDFLEQLKVLFSDANTGVQIEVNPSVVADKASTAALEVMNEELFWKLMRKLDWQQDSTDAVVAPVIAPVIAALAKRSLADIYQFEEILANKLYQLDGLEYAQEMGEQAYREGTYFSVDYFLYARCWVVASGKTAFEQVLADPSQMPKDSDFEALLYVAEKAYELKTGKSDYHYLPQKSYETYSNYKAWGKEEPTTLIL